MGETRGCGDARELAHHRFAGRPRDVRLPHDGDQAERDREFPDGGGGKTAVYMLRWVNTRGEKGPWSEVTTATVAA
ncbi:MAG: hypothetical protein IT437_11080 [Phycisphaerales bacterium]|nr:hypothetical protein [Phycisphaerales bacterium]